MKDDVKFLSAIKRIFKYSSGFKYGFILVFVCSILAAIFSVLTPYLLGLITSSLFESVTNKLPLNFKYIYILIVILLVLYVLYSLFNYFRNYISSKISQELCYNLRRDLIKKVNKLEISKLEKRKKGDLISIVINDVEKVNDFFSESVPELIYHTILMIGIIFMMLFINVKLSLISFLTMPLIFIFLSFIVKKTQKYFELQQSSLGSVNAFIEESITNDLVIKSFNKEKYFSKKFEGENKELFTNNFKSTLYSGLAHPIINFVNNLNYCIVIGIGAYFVITGSMKVGQIQAFVSYMSSFNRPLALLGEIIGTLQTTAASVNRIFTIVDENVSNTGKVKKINNPKVIELKNVDFSYNKDKKILKDISFDIKRGEQVAIVGKTGSGKTTIINLLMGFYNAEAGNILIDGIDIKDIKKSELRNKFSMVLQDTWIWNDTLKENIVMGSCYTDKEINKAVKDSELDHIIKSFPNGINFMINEESDNVSEGEKQLITIARALITKPDVLILDEATSNVDSRLEYLINKSMKKLMKNRTSIVIAHRLSTIVESDKIVVIDEGEVKEIGTHKELLKKKGYYYNLYNSGLNKMEV